MGICKSICLNGKNKKYDNERAHGNSKASKEHFDNYNHLKLSNKEDKENVSPNMKDKNTQIQNSHFQSKLKTDASEITEQNALMSLNNNQKSNNYKLKNINKIENKEPHIYQQIIIQNNINKNNLITNNNQINPNQEQQITDLNNMDKNLIINSSLLVMQSSGNYKTDYKILKQLGEGSYGTVFLVNHIPSGQLRAMKVIKKQESSESQKKIDAEIINEIQILKNLDHPNIIKIFEFYNTVRFYFLITEFCGEGELFHKLTSEGPFSEKASSYIMLQILSAVNYCHGMNIVHRDLKPENIMIQSHCEDDENKNKQLNNNNKADLNNKKLSSSSSNINLNFSSRLYKVKIIDFGTAKIFEKNQIERKFIGSLFYIAPEVLLLNYNEKCDLWSCGVIMYILLSGRPPFSGLDETEIFENIKIAKYDLQSDVWKNISAEAKNLIANLLEKNVYRRFSAQEALSHQWFKKHKVKELFNSVEPLKVKEMLENLQKTACYNSLQKIALAYLVHNNPQNPLVEDAFRLFNILDINENGKISRQELKEGLKNFVLKKDLDLNDTVNRIFNLIDADNNGFIEYEEFVRGCISKEKFINDDIIKMSFLFFDKDHNGEISYEEIKSLFEKNFRKRINVERSIKDIIKEVDTNKDGKISYQEFFKMMKSMLS